MLWEHEPQASVSTAFSSSPKLSRVCSPKLSLFLTVDDKWDFPWYIMRERCITILYHASDQHDSEIREGMMGRLDVVPSNI